jgi:DmsE family decaheme c-type cytochrome
MDMRKIGRMSAGHWHAIQKHWSSKGHLLAAPTFWISITWAGLNFAVLPALAPLTRAEAKPLTFVHADDLGDENIAALQQYVQQIGAAPVQDDRRGNLKNPHHHVDDPDFAALREYSRQIGAPQVTPGDAPELKLAEADNAFDALREFFQKRSQPESVPNSPPQTPPSSSPHSAPSSRPRVAPARPRAAAPRHEVPVIAASYVGPQTCLFCHASQAASFDKTLMGRIGKTHQGKFDCENCHGPASAHVRAVGCEQCHGPGGVSRKRGIPSLAGQDPQYLVPAMQAYITGHRKHQLMQTILSGVGQAELHDIAVYYAHQHPTRAQTPLIGDPSAGKRASALCAGCHGERGISVSPAWPSLAGQDAQYLADAIKAYKHGSRAKAIACAGCHGDGGVTARPGTPSLVGQEPQYLIRAMKAYASGERKHVLMNILLSGVKESELNSFAVHYAQQAPERAKTPLVGDASAGKTASALCANCHGEQGSSVNPSWPSLAGQDAQYLVQAIKAYQHGTRAKAIDCAGCHGAGGVSKRQGIPSLIGQDPQYLVAAMKAYAAGQRKHQLMTALLSGVDEAEFNRIALFYAGQISARAQTPSIGDPAAGKAASAACAGCHGEQGVSANPMWPSLAGQDARYLANALKAYKDGSRGDETMKAFAASLDDAAINNIASYFASLQPGKVASAQNAAVGREPVLIRNELVSSLDDRTINDIAGYFASQRPAQPSGGRGAAKAREPVVIRNGLVASLDERTANNIASYFASLAPEQPRSARGAPARPTPILVSKAVPPNGRSVGGIISFRSDDPGRRVEENNAICLSCHERGDRTYWNGSTHESRGVACTECHTIMRAVSRKANLKTPNELQTCFQCHKDRRAQIFRSSHMPVREGKVTCTDCHNPHGTATEAMLRENSVNDTCYKCHAEKRGPFLFEHAPVRENCLSCHDPHGTNNEYLLKISRPRLCAECHGFGHNSLVNGPLAVETIARSCQNCHTAIHGSNSPAGALLQR